MRKKNEKMKMYREKIEEQYGFCADPLVPAWKNLRNYIGRMNPTTMYSSIAIKKSCHNYCKDGSMPRGLPSLIGLGLKYCVKWAKPPRRSTTTLFKRLAAQIRRIAFFKKKDLPENEEYNPSLYIPSEWKPPPADKEIENALDSFRVNLHKARGRFMKPTLANVTASQGELFSKVRKSDKFIVIEADKNLGGSVMLRDDYIRRGVSEHLGNQAVYERLTEAAAKNHLKRLDYLLHVFVSKHRPLKPNEDPRTAMTSDELTKPDETYLLRALNLKSAGQFARFRMTIKVHKKPPKMRPIVCCAGTRLNYLSKWLDYQFQRLKPFIPSYIRDSHELLAKLKALGRLPRGTKVFTADAVSMYTNIDTEHAIQVISAWLDSLSELPLDFPVNAVKDAMKIVMRNNIFEWGDTYFRQLLGTAMGTSAACMWATAYYGVHESESLLPTHSTHLVLYVRFIDDIFGIWNGSDEAWEAFKGDINNFGILTWEICEPSSSANFLDLTISIEQDGSLTTKTYQKAMNLYQYIPPQSAHTPGMTKGVIYSLMKNYHLQNSKQSDYLTMATLLF